MMAAARVLRLVRDEDCVATLDEYEPISESFYFGHKGTTTVAMKTARQFVIPRALPFLVERRPPPRRVPRAPCVAAPPRRAPRQQDLIERYQHLQVYGSRPRSIGRRKLNKAERAQFRTDFRFLQRAGVYAHRPLTWGECQDTIIPKGPCGWVSCRVHLAYEVDEKTGVIKQNFPGREVWELDETCGLKVAGEGGHTLERTGELGNITLERARQLVDAALAKLKGRRAVQEMRDADAD